MMNKRTTLLFLIVLLIIGIGGYVLFFQTKSNFRSLDHSYQTLKGKLIIAEKQLSKIQEKYLSSEQKNQSAYSDYKKIQEQNVHLINEVAALRIERLQLLKTIDELKAKISTDPSASTTPTPEPVEPITMRTESDSTIQTTPKTQTHTAQSEKIPENSYQCPTELVVKKNLFQGNWSQGSLTWWVSTTPPTYREGDLIFPANKIEFDGQAVLCHYPVTLPDSPNAIIIKGINLNKTFELPAQSGWIKCDTPTCQNRCDDPNKQSCYFLLSKMIENIDPTVHATNDTG